MKKMKERESVFSKIMRNVQILSYLIILLSTCLVLIYVRNSFFDAMEAKADLFDSLMKLLSPFFGFLAIYKMTQSRHNCSFFLIFLVLLFLFTAISTYYSFSPADAFSGIQGWRVGGYAICCLILMVFSLKNVEQLDWKWLFPFFIVCLFEFALVILESMGLDLFSMKTSLEKSARFAYFGTLGNSNWNVGFFSLVVPFFVCRYIGEKNAYLKCFYFITGLCGIIASILNGADGIYLAYALCIPFMLPFILDNLVSIRDALFLGISVLLGLLLTWNMPQFTSFFRYYDSIGKLFFNDSLLLAFIILFIIVLLVSYRLEEDTYLKYRKKIITIFISLFCVLEVGSLLFASHYRGDSFDSYRFELWRLSLKQFKEFSLFNKFFGLGPELTRNIYARLFSKYGVIFNASHSEPIQLLVTLGASGLFAWLGLWTCLFVSYFKKKIFEREELLGFYVGLIAYFGQSFVNSATIPNLMILVIFVTMGYRSK